MVIQGFKTAKLFNNIDMAKTDIETFSKLAHETLDTKAAV
jgi:AmiR/NasT family two-component response regulator